MISLKRMRDLIGYLKVNSDLFHRGNHGDFGNPHNQYRHKYQCFRTTNIDAVYINMYTKFAKIKLIKGPNTVFYTYLFRINNCVSSYNSFYEFLVTISIASNGTVTMKAFAYNNSGIPVILVNSNIIYQVITNSADLYEINFHINPNKAYMQHNIEVLNAINSDGAYGVLDRTAMDSLVMYAGEAYVDKATILGFVTVAKNYAYSIPALGQWDTGTVLWNCNYPIVPGALTGWICSIGGTPGTWVPIGQLGVKVDTTANRPVGDSVFQGYEYFDTTLAAAGKPIKWNGVNWVDYTGAIV